MSLIRIVMALACVVCALAASSKRRCSADFPSAARRPHCSPLHACTPPLSPDMYTPHASNRCPCADSKDEDSKEEEAPRFNPLRNTTFPEFLAGAWVASLLPSPDYAEAPFIASLVRPGRAPFLATLDCHRSRSWPCPHVHACIYPADHHQHVSRDHLV